MPKEGIRFPRAVVVCSFGQNGFWEPNLGPQELQSNLFNMIIMHFMLLSFSSVFM